MFLHDILTALNGRAFVEFKVKILLYAGTEMQVHSSEETVAVRATSRHWVIIGRRWMRGPHILP